MKFKKKISFIIFGIAIISIAGCDRINDLYTESEPTISIAPGYSIDINGKKAVVWGFENCEGDETKPLRNEAANNNCIVVRKGQETVNVMIHFQETSFKENG